MLYEEVPDIQNVCRMPLSMQIVLRTLAQHVKYFCPLHTHDTSSNVVMSFSMGNGTCRLGEMFI